MKLAVLFSGGKDSTLALLRAMEREEVVCLITIISENRESYMFHTPNIGLTKLQAEAMDLPILQRSTEGKKEEELEDLKHAIKQAEKKFRIEGVVTGAVESTYQASRVQRICFQLGLWCFNPLWKMDQRDLLGDVVERCFKVLISGVFAYPLDKSWLGKEINHDLIGRLVALQKEYGISPSGEGGEIETTVLDAPMFRKRINVTHSLVESDGTSAVFRILKAELTEK
jgi:ABC transporter with metal-binding/Fe-S-binding domain ATP-binding protein